MKKKIMPIAIPIGLALLGICVLSTIGRSMLWRGTGLVYFSRPSDPKAPFEPYWLSKQMQAVSNIISAPAFHREVARASAVHAHDFVLQNVGQYRSTTILDLTFAAKNRQSADAVSSNASVALVRFFSTNNPAQSARFLTNHSWLPPPLWRRTLDDLASMLRP